MMAFVMCVQCLETSGFTIAALRYYVYYAIKNMICLLIDLASKKYFFAYFAVTYVL